MENLKSIGISSPLAEDMPPFIAITIKPQCTKRYRSWPPLAQAKYIYHKLRAYITKFQKDGFVVPGYELHFELFGNGNIHAHGLVYLETAIMSKLFSIQFEKGFQCFNSSMGSQCIMAKIPFGDNPLDSWLTYVNKQNIIDPKLILTPYGMANGYTFDNYKFNTEVIAPALSQAAV